MKKWFLKRNNHRDNNDNNDNNKTNSINNNKSNNNQDDYNQQIITQLSKEIKKCILMEKFM